MSGRPTYLSPHDLAWLYDQCPRCFWLKLKGIKPPSDTMPGIFRDIDQAQKSGISIEALRATGIMAASFLPGEHVVSSAAVFDGSLLAIKGKTDRRILLDDGSMAIIDYKTAQPRPESMARYWRQLMAYLYGIEHAESGPQEVTQLGLVVFTPVKFKVSEGVQSYYMGRLQHMPVEIDRPKFERLLDKIGGTLAKDDMPQSGASCDKCRHADAVVGMRLNQLLARITDDPELGPELAATLAAKGWVV